MSEAQMTAHAGRYSRIAGTWVYTDSLLRVPGAKDMTLSNHYNLRCVGGYVLVPRHLARNEPELAWCLDHADQESTEARVPRIRGNDPSVSPDTVMVAIEEWDARSNAEPIGMWAPELTPGDSVLARQTRQVALAERDLRVAESGRDAARARRDGVIAARLADGWTHAQLAEATGLTRGRIGQIATGARAGS